MNYLTNQVQKTMQDPDTDPRLLPSAFRGGDNSRRIRHYRIALKKAIKNCLSPLQQQQIELYYRKGLNMSQIAHLQNRGCSAVSKSMQASHAAIRRYVDQYMEIYDALEQEWLREEDAE